MPKKKQEEMYGNENIFLVSRSTKKRDTTVQKKNGTEKVHVVVYYLNYFILFISHSNVKFKKSTHSRCYSTNIECLYLYI